MRLVRGTWRVLVGVKDALALLLLLLFFGLLFAALLARPNPRSSGGGALLLDLTGSLVEQPSQPGAFSVLTQRSAPTREYRLRDVVRALDAATTDSSVKAVVLDLDGFTGGGQATIGAAGEALDRVRKAGKPVLAFAVGYTDDGYQLAAHASEVWLDPLGAVLLTGPGRSQLYYKGLLDKIGVTPRVYRVGEFKSAVEPYTRTDMSPAAREANQLVANNLWASWQSEVTAARPKAQLASYIAAPEAAIAAAGGETAVAAQRSGLVDKLGDRIAFGRRIAEIAGSGDDKSAGAYRTIKFDNWVASQPDKTNGDAIGVVTVAGDIVDGKAPPGTAGGDTIAKLLLDSLAKKNLKALVVRVDSPGGSVTGSERIRTAILEARRKGLPVVVSMGSVAASGGYLVATAGQKIIAEPSTITGSIGVFGILPTFQGALAKVGLTADGIKTTPLSGEPDLLRGTSPEFDRLIQAGIDDFYRRFIGLVGQARGLTPVQVDHIGQGRIWDGNTARKIGLVDGFGGVDTAIAEAAKLAKLDPAKVHAVYIEESPSFFGRIADSISRGRGQDATAPDAFSRIAAQPQALLAHAIWDAKRLASGPAMQVRCVDCPVSHAAIPPVEASIAELLIERFAR